MIYEPCLCCLLRCVTIGVTRGDPRVLSLEHHNLRAHDSQIVPEHARPGGSGSIGELWQGDGGHNGQHQDYYQQLDQRKTV